MIKHLCSVFIIWFLAITSVQAQTYIRDYTYKASDIDSKVTSRINALDQVKLILLQEIGTHIRHAINITQDSSGNSYASEDVEAITAGLTKVDILEEKWNGETFYLKASIVADTERVLNALEAFKNEKSEESEQQLQALKDTQRKLKESREEIAKLRNLLAQANSSEKEKIVVKYIDRVEQISVLDMVAKGYNFDQQGQYEDAVYWYRKAADQGLASAQSNLGNMYKLGLGVEQSDKQAVAWGRKAADQGYASAQYNLGVMYRDGLGVEQSYMQAVVWFHKAADQGHATAHYNLGAMYRHGQGVEQNDKQADAWFRKAAEQGDADAQYNLGVRYANGQRVEQSYKQAFPWFSKAADQGYTKAQYNLGVMYRDGLGVEQSDKQAIAWFRKAADQGYTDAQNNLGIMYNHLAWGYATCKLGCEGDKAIYWANELLSIPNVLKNAARLDTVSAAYARANKFDEAINYQKKAIALLTSKEDIIDYTSRLNLYKKGKTYTSRM